MSFDFMKLRDPGYFSENRLAPHSDHVAYADMEELRWGESSLRYSLDGLWKFFHALNEEQVIKGFEAAEYDCRPWADIPVPAHIQMEGYGAPQYANIQLPWDGREYVPIGEIPKEFNPVACYVKYFKLPKTMEGKRIFISFQGAESCVALWLNGHYVGFAGDTFTPSEFELTPYLTEGENKLACKVYRWNIGSWLEDQDFFRFSGLFRSVYLWAAPEAHVEDIRIRTLLDDSYTDAELAIDARLMLAHAAEDATLRVELMDGDELLARQEGQGACQHFSVPVKAPELWSSESPRLYTLLLTLLDGSGKVLEAVRERVGFRRFELKDGVMKLNGKRIVFKGTNRHDFCAETGRAITYEKVRRDLVTMKRNNINAVRTSHYPNASMLYALCDELGLYVIDENNMESHHTWDLVMRGSLEVKDALPGDRMDYLPMLLNRVEHIYGRDKNHPCVLIWSCGNESFGGDVIYEMSARFRALDPTRLVHYEGVAHDRRRNETTDMESRMYTNINDIRAYLAKNRERPFILCEYVHAMGNSNGAMHKYTEYAYEEPLYQGGFIWDFIDQSIRKKDRYGNVTYGYGGDFDDRPNDGNFSGNGIVYGDGTESPKLQEVKYNYQNIVGDVKSDTVLIHNRSMFTSTDAYECVAILERNGVEIARTSIATDIPPLESREYPLPFPIETHHGEYAITLSFRLKQDEPWAERGYEVAFAQGSYAIRGQEQKQWHQPLRVIRGDFNTGVVGDCFRVMFGDAAGGLTSYVYGGKEMIKAVPKPNFWRAPNDNDRGNGMPMRYAQWKLASMYAYPSAMPEFASRSGHPKAIENDDGSVSIGYIYNLPTLPPAQCELIYTVYPCGTVRVTLEYEPVAELKDMPEFGVIMKLDADYDRLRYYGLGPAENTSDRHKGARLGIHSTTVAENVSRYLMPQECGSRTGVRWAELTDAKGRGMRFTGDGMTFSALPYTPHELENAAHDYELPPVHHTVVRAALMQMGVAGDDSWGARTHEEYLLDVSKKLSFTFSFKGIV